MQAHPQSNPAARNHSTPHPSGSPSQTPHPFPPPAESHPGAPRPPHPQLRAPLAQACNPTASASVAGHAGLAHDAGNLLGALELYCNLLSLPGVLGPEHRHYATELSLISERSSDLIRRLLALPRSTSPDQLQPDSDAPSATQPASRRNLFARDEATACNPIRSHTLRNLTPVLQGIAAGTAKVTVFSPASLPSISLPAEIVERITINLVRNAAQAIGAQRSEIEHGSSDAPPLLRPGEIRIALAVAASRLRLTVEDNGPGMSPAAVAEFLRPSPLPPGAEHGLGHRIVHELATGSGGQISIRIRPGRGTVFCIAWPVPSARPHLDSPSTLAKEIAPRGFSTC